MSLYLEMSGEGAVDDEVAGGVEEDEDVRDGLHADELDRRDVGPVLGDAGRDLGGSRERLDSQDDPEDVADHEDGADGHEDHGQVHLPVVVARLHVEAGLHDAPVDETEMLSTPYSLSKKLGCCCL